MEQIYYTQCPMGYGLGASNGFQIKRIGPGYPPSGDVRHLAMRAFLPASNGKSLAPGSLRYRRVGPVAEVAWLEPRSREYETERGQWGRPGGHFAHGLRLDAAELSALENWPAGLFDRPFWRRSDPEPSRGRRPEDLTVGRDDLLAPPEFSHVAPAIDLDPETLARLLAAVADAVRSGRAVFLIDEADRLGPRIAALTFAFPSVLRSELTFSTYHDRPEELSGFRIQGTVPSALINRAALAGLGPIADLTSGRFEPSTPPPAWARSLSTWLTRRDPEDAEDWSRTDDRARRARRPDDPATLWSDPWLDGLVGMANSIRPAATSPSIDADWRTFADRASWAAAAGLADELALARGPRWWRSVIREASSDRSAHDAFWSLVLSPVTWEGEAGADPSSWGAIAAHFWVRYRPSQREQLLDRALRRITPADRLTRFLDGLIRSLPAESGQSALEWLERRDEVDPRILLPIRARVAVGLLRTLGRADALDHVLGLAIDQADALPTVLDLIADEAGRDESAGPIAVAIAQVLEGADLDVRSSMETWALRRHSRGGDDWLSPVLRRLFATEINRADWDALRDRTSAALRPTLARVCLEAASGSDVIPESFLWSVEDLLLRIDEADRPSDRRYVERYLEILGSPHALALRLRTRAEGLREWLAAAREGGALLSGSIELLDDAEFLGRLIDGSREMPDEERLARLPESDRAELLQLLIDQLAEGEFGLCEPIVERCSRSWPGAFEPGAEGVDRLAVPLATLLLQFVLEPRLWIESLSRILDWIGLIRRPGAPWAWDGIASRIVAETCRLTVDPDSSWALRAALLRDDCTYPALFEDLGRDLLGETPRHAGEVTRRWAGSLDKGTHTARFFELLLNACDGPRLAVVVPEFSDELRTLGALPWWSGPKREEDDPPDLRAAFATQVPMAPLSSPRLLRSVEAWIDRREPASPFSTVRSDPDFLPLLDEGPVGPVIEDHGVSVSLSDRARARWNCIRALTNFHWTGKTDEARWADLMRWRKSEDSGDTPPISSLDPDDRYDFLAWLIVALDHPGVDSFSLESLARWVVKDLGLRFRDRIPSGPERIAALGVEVSPDRLRLGRDLAHQMARQLDD